ncbi:MULTISPECIES: hypothetical protein [unclassified Pseudovibrio]|uniref:hypothetical protein n=1 Tax=unclassified Pseudovibrio TaxID=2627060 RepID=UPI0007AE9F78|nr:MULTISPECIES: hypothetical protein [unclassified Pseudovibrio]KZK98829.1 hypothetical protein PsW74_03418 [Pseudovibrio sp. W74]KZL09322.1 hypothetical protein PsAD14_02383 [Pseudovibrio sp. Ad14]
MLVGMLKKQSILGLLLLGACTTTSGGPNEVTENIKAIAEINKELKAGKGIVFTDLHYGSRRCRLPILFFQSKRTNTVYKFSDGEAVLFKSLLSRPGYKALPAGDYWISRIICEEQYSINFGGLLSGGYIPASSKQLSQRAPSFTVSANEISHIGTIQLVTREKGGYFSDEKVTVELVPTKKYAIKQMKTKLPSLVANMTFNQ